MIWHSISCSEGTSGGVTLTVAVALLLPGLSSWVALETLAVLVTVPATVGDSTTVKPALAPLTMVPAWHTRVPESFTQPGALTKFVPAGTASLTTTSVRPATAGS